MVTLVYDEKEARQAWKKEAEEAVQEASQSGIKDGRLISIRSLIETLGLSAQKAMDALKIAPSEQPYFAAML